MSHNFRTDGHLSDWTNPPAEEPLSTSLRYRPHRGMLADAMKEAVEVPDRAALYRHIWQTEGDGAITIKPYMDEPEVGFCELPPVA